MALVALALGLRPDPVGAFVEGETLVLTDIVNSTDEPVFEGALEGGLRIKLEESPYLNVLGPEIINETLALMRLSADSAISRELGREVCRRRGARRL